MKLFSRTGLAAAVTTAALSTTVLAAPAMADANTEASSSNLVGISTELLGNDAEGTAEGGLDFFSNLSSGEDEEDNPMGSIENATSFLQLISVGLTVATAVVGLVSAF